MALASRMTGSRGRKVLLVLLSVVTSLLAAEGLLRFSADVEHAGAFGPRYLYRGHEQAGYVLTSGFEAPRGTDPESGEAWPAVHVNRLGARSVEVPRSKPVEGFRILSYGDSSTFGFGVTDHESFSHKLHQLIADLLPGSDVLNFGIPDSSTVNQFGWLRTEGMTLNPDLVLFNLFTGDDLQQNEAQRDGPTTGFAFGDRTSFEDMATYRMNLEDGNVLRYSSANSWLLTLDRFFHRRSLVWRKASDRFWGLPLTGRVLERVGVVEIGLPRRQASLEMNALPSDAQLEQTVRLFGEIQRYLSQRGVELVVNIIPGLWAGSRGVGRFYFDQKPRSLSYEQFLALNMRIAETLRRQGLDVVDIYRFSRERSSFHQLSYDASQGHFSPRDHEFIAAALFDHLNGHHLKFPEQDEVNRALRRHLRLMIPETRPDQTFQKQSMAVTIDDLERQYLRIPAELVEQIEVDKRPRNVPLFDPRSLLSPPVDAVFCDPDWSSQTIRVYLRFRRPVSVAALSVGLNRTYPDFRIHRMMVSHGIRDTPQEPAWQAVSDVDVLGPAWLQVFGVGLTSELTLFLTRFSGTQCSMVTGLHIFEDPRASGATAP